MVDQQEIAVERGKVLLPSEEALTRIYEDYSKKVYRYFRRNGLGHESAEDLAQEVFCRFLRFGDTLQTEEQIRNWLFKVARNLLIDNIRQKARRPRMAIPLESLHDAKLMPKPLQTDDPEQAILAEISKGEIQRMISELNPHYADVIRLKEIGGLSYQQIANKLGLTTKSVEGRLSRARAKLKTRQFAFHRCFSEETLCAVPRRA